MRAAIVESIRRRPLPELEGDSTRSGGELSGIRQALEGVIDRLDRIEEERDFYKELLDSPGTRGELPAPSGAAASAEEEEASDKGPV